MFPTIFGAATPGPASSGGGMFGSGGWLGDVLSTIGQGAQVATQIGGALNALQGGPGGNLQIPTYVPPIQAPSQPAVASSRPSPLLVLGLAAVALYLIAKK